MNEPLQQRTAKAAIRLLKTRIREYVYVAKQAEAGQSDTRWGPMLLVEQSFTTTAVREWQGVLGLWAPLDQDQARTTVKRIVLDAFPEAATDVLTIFEESEIWPIRKLIDQYHKDLNLDAFLELGTS